MVMIRQAERPYTADDLAEMPDDGRRYEVLGGELIVSPSPSPRHQGVLLRLAKVIDDYVEGERWGSLYTAPLDVHPGPHDIVQPDLVAVSRDHLGRVENRGVFGVPDLVAEVISPGNSRTDRVRKSATYSAYGVPEYWLVDPETETILPQVLREGRYHSIPSDDGLVRSEILSSLVIDPHDIFAVPEWKAGLESK
jgi:Uma2 family endonuclease